jgi:hypothetical protein
VFGHAPAAEHGEEGTALTLVGGAVEDQHRPWSHERRDERVGLPRVETRRIAGEDGSNGIVSREHHARRMPRQPHREDVAIALMTAFEERFGSIEPSQ